ncbi:MAG: bifunctional diaminohydroxyphosphoribosylaminopyrimidine deaminase/5-amino-6-(5-phosphoribosylamino)uracil reductase RibD [Bacteroidales bacterium]|nr:bifunctional diaminohydroxyphosphoribosylaminopyrimidine deaminase/5-amino-6-(5-phosphoribosylamino)uracil reductase RibD [Bacteroidales bacterium]
MQTDELFIQRCFQLALMGAGHVSPNPMVGAVITAEGKIIGEGYHMQYGQAHAEVNAVNSVRDKELLSRATVYVSLEPCSHYGKTPPCAELLVKNKIKKCVIANFDPNPKVAGKGIQMLKDAGIEVQCGVLQEQGRFLNRRFFCFQEKKRPYIILKLAQSADGYMDINTGSEEHSDYWITNDALKVFVHKMRAENDAFFAGFNTVKNDNCRLNVRHIEGRNPLRITYDRDLSLAKTLNFFDCSQPTVIFNNKQSRTINQNLRYIKTEDSVNYIEEILQHLYNMGVSSLVVEGGKKTAEYLLNRNLWDEACILTGNTVFNKGIKTPVIATRKKASTSRVSDNRIDVYYNDNAF